MADNHTKIKSQLLDRALSDPNVSPAAFKVLYALLGHVNRKTGEAYPSRERIVEVTGLSLKTVQESITTLTKKAKPDEPARNIYMHIESGGGRRVVSRYTPNTDGLADVKIAPFPKVDTDVKITPLPEPVPTETVQKTTANGAKFTRKRCKIYPREPLDELFEEPLERDTREKKTALEKQKASRLQPYFPSQNDIEVAREFFTEKGRGDLADRVDDIAARFRDHHTSKGNRFVDWQAAWRNWCRNEIKFTKPNAASATGGMSAARGVMSELREGD